MCFSGLSSFCKTPLHSASKRQPSPAWHRREQAKRASAKKLLREAEARKLVARHHGSHIDRRSREPLVIPDVYRFGPKTPNWGCGNCAGRMEIGRREQCADTVERQHHTEFVQLQNRRMRKRRRSMPRRDQQWQSAVDCEAGGAAQGSEQ